MRFTNTKRDENETITAYDEDKTNISSDRLGSKSWRGQLLARDPKKRKNDIIIMFFPLGRFFFLNIMIYEYRKFTYNSFWYNILSVFDRWGGWIFLKAPLEED